MDIGARVEEFTTWVAIVEAQRTSKLSHTQNGDECLQDISKLLDQVIESFVYDIDWWN